MGSFYHFMNRYRTCGSILLFFIMVLGSLFFWLLQQDRPMTLEEERIFATYLTYKDFPSGFVQGQGGLIEVKQGQARGVFFNLNVANKSWVGVSQAVYVFPTEQLALQFIANSHFGQPSPKEWITDLPDLTLHTQADSQIAECLPINWEEETYRLCNVQLRYKEMFIALSASVFEDKWLRMSDFDRLIQIIDQRAMDANQKYKQVK